MDSSKLLNVLIEMKSIPRSTQVEISQLPTHYRMPVEELEDLKTTPGENGDHRVIIEDVYPDQVSIAVAKYYNGIWYWYANREGL